MNAPAAPGASETAAAATTAPTVTLAAARRLLVLVLFLLGGFRHGLGLHRVELQAVEEPADRIAARRFPIGDGAARLVVELAVDRRGEAQRLEPALHIAPLVAIEVDVLFGLHVGVGRLGGRIDHRLDRGGRTRDRRLGIVERGNARAGDAAEHAVGIAGEMSVQLLGLVAFLDGAPELHLEVAARRTTPRLVRRWRLRSARRLGSLDRSGLVHVEQPGQVGAGPGRLLLLGEVGDAAHGPWSAPR